MNERPNLLFVFADQLRASSLPLYGENQIETPNLDRLAGGGVTFTNCVSTCPVCTPYRSMLITGRHPQTTGHIINSTRTRHTEISIADAFAAQGYRTGWIGKWHLHTGVWPAQNVPDWVPEGRDRMGFQYWRAYNIHMVYFNGFVNGDDWNFEQWEGYAKPSTDTRSASWTGWETTPSAFSCHRISHTLRLSTMLRMIAMNASRKI